MIEQFLDAVMPVVLECIAGLLIIAVAMMFLVVSTGGYPPPRRDK